MLPTDSSLQIICLTLFLTFATKAMKNNENKQLKILITAPSLDEKENISGISTLVRQIIGRSGADFEHLQIGRKDSEKSNLSWIVKQIFLPFRFLRRLFADKIDIIHINTALATLSIIRDFVLVFIAKLAGYPVLLHIHGGRFLTEEFNSSLIKYFAGEMVQMADTVLVLSDFEKQKLLQNWKNLNIKVLPNAVEITAPSELKRKNDGIKTVIFFGRIHESKGLKEIIVACQVLQKEYFTFRFKCYGTGPQEEFFTREMKTVLGDKFSYEGIVAGNAKQKALAEADIFLLPSYFEGLPVAMLEAMAAKCVVLASDVGSIKKIITDGKNGFLVKPHQTEQIIQKLKILLTEDFTDIENNARQTVVENFAIQNYTVKLEEIYEEMKK